MMTNQWHHEKEMGQQQPHSFKKTLKATSSLIFNEMIVKLKRTILKYFITKKKDQTLILTNNGTNFKQ